MRLVVYIVVTVVTIFISEYLLPGVHVDSILTAVVLAVVLGVINSFIKPILTILTLPITLITLGLFYFILNALLVLFADFLVSGFKVDGFFWALAFSLVFSLVSWFLNLFLKD